jgi:hypothetical protein
MSVVDCVFAAVAEAPAQVADWLVETLGCEVMSAEGEVVRLRVRGSADDGWFGVVVQRNGYVEADPEPDDVQAMDAYGIEIQVRGGGREEVLHRETRLIFDKVVADRPAVPMLLVHNLDTLVAAHLPGRGTYTFDQSITPDAPDLEVWCDWIVQ